MTQQYFSPYGTVTEDIVNGDNKLDLLEKNKEEKLARLTKGGLNQGADLEESYSVINGNIDNNRNKVHNNYNDAELQYLLGYSTSKYANEALDSKNARRLYLYDTKTEGSKGGVSTGGAATSDVRYDNTIDPKYAQEWRTTGEEGPDLSKKRLDIGMDFDAATVMEGLWHGNERLLKNRKYPDVTSPEALKAGGGVSEYYKQNGEEFLGDSRFYNLTDERIRQLEQEFDKKVSNIKLAKEEELYNQNSFDRMYVNAGGELGRGEEAIDLAQSQGLKLYADIADAARSASRSIAKKFGASDETVDKWLPKNAELIGTGRNVQDIRENQELRNRMTGFDSRYEWAEEQKEYQQNVKEGKYVDAAWNVVKNFDRYLAESAPEMAAILIPYAGIPAVAASRLNNQMEEFEKTNGRKMTTEEAFNSAATIIPLLYAEKLIVKTGFDDVVGNISKGNIGKAAIGVGTSASGEALQEGGEAIQEQWSTGKAEDRSSLHKLGEYATSDETIGGVIAGGIMGGGIRGGAEGAQAVGTAMFSSPSEEQLARELAKTKAKTAAAAKANVADKFSSNATESTTAYTPTQDDLDIEESLGVNSVSNLFAKSTNADELFTQLNASKIQLLNNVYDYDIGTNRIIGIKDETKIPLVEKWLDQYGEIQADSKGNIPKGIKEEIEYIKQANTDYATASQVAPESPTSATLDTDMMERAASGSADMIHEKIGTGVDGLSESDLIQNIDKEIDSYVKASGLDVALKDDVETLKSSIKTKVLDKYNISGMVLPKGIGFELDKEALAAEVREKAGIKTGLQNRAMSKEGKVVETGSVTNQDLNDILTGEGTVYDSSHPNTKFRERVVRKLEPTEAGNVLSTLKDANEKLDKSIEKNLAEAGKYLKGDVVGNMKRLMAIAIDAINSQVASDTELRASVADPENSDSQLKESEYWAGTSNLLEQIAKNYATSHGIKLTAEDTKQLSKVYRPLSRFALQLLLDADLIEFTNDNMWSVAGATVGRDNKPLSTTNATGVKTKIVNNTLTGDKAVLVSDIGVRLKDSNIIDRSNPIVDEGNIQKYQSELGNAFKRVVSLMLPNNERLPSNEPIDKPIKHDDFIGVTKKTEEILQEHTNKPFKFKTTGYMLDILKYLKGLNETSSGGLMKALSKKPEIKDFLLLTDNQAELLKVGDEGSIQGKLDNLIGILDNLDLLTNEDGIYETFQIDINNRLTIEQTVSNYQGDKVYARPMMGVGKYIISAKDFAAIEAHIAGLIDDLAGPNDKNQDPIDVLEKYTELFNKIVEAAEKDQGGANFLENLMFRISTTPDLKHLKKKGGIRALSILQGAKDVIDSYSNDKISKEEGKETRGYIETEYIPERDASASGVFNTTMNIIGRNPEFFTKRLKELGVVIDGEGDVNTTDAYSILKGIVDTLMDSLKTADPKLGYSAATKDVESVQKLKNIINDDKFIRNLAKYPIMTWFYSAEEKSIVNNLVSEATKELITRAVDGDVNVLNYLSTIMNKEITAENIKKVKVGSKEHKALRNELAKVGEVFYRNLNTAFPEVEQNKQEMKDYFEYLDKNSTFKGTDYWKGEIRTAISVMQGDPKTTSLYKWKNKIIAMKAAEKIEAGLVTEEESNMLITERVRLSNETSMMAFFAHLVDSAQAIKWLESSDSDYAVQSKHDGFSGRPQDLLKSQKAVEAFTVELHQKYDFTNEMAIAMENTAAKMEKDLDLYSGKDRDDLTQKIRDLRAKADKIKTVNNPRMEAKSKVLANAKTYLFGTEGTDRDQYIGSKAKGTTSVEPVKTNEEVKQEQTKKILSNIYDVIASLDTDDERKSSILENKEKVTIVSVTKDSRAGLIANFEGTKVGKEAFKKWINSGNSFTSNGVVYIGDKTLLGKDEISKEKAEAEEILDVVSHEIEHAVVDSYIDKEYKGAIKREVEVVNTILKRAFGNKDLKGVSSRAAGRIEYIQKFVDEGNILQAVKELVAISKEDTVAGEVFNALNKMAKVKDGMLLGAIKSIWAKVQELLSKTPVEEILTSDNFDTYSLAVAVKSIQNKARSTSKNNVIEPTVTGEASKNKAEAKANNDIMLEDYKTPFDEETLSSSKVILNGVDISSFVDKIEKIC